jgi:hypothetical protein
MPGNTRGLFFLLAALALSGCAEIRLNWAMERVEERYVQLFYDIETADFLHIRASARGVREALADPVIAGYRSEPRYQRLLAETSEAAVLIVGEAVIKEGGEAKREGLLSLRGRLSHGCQGCHEQFLR